MGSASTWLADGPMCVLRAACLCARARGCASRCVRARMDRARGESGLAACVYAPIPASPHARGSRTALHARTGRCCACADKFLGASVPSEKRWPRAPNAVPPVCVCFPPSRLFSAPHGSRCAKPSVELTPERRPALLCVAFRQRYTWNGLDCSDGKQYPVHNTAQAFRSGLAACPRPIARARTPTPCRCAT
jgi:hypothetical protein